MSAPAANMSFFVGDKYACIRIAGRASVNSSVDFKKLVRVLCQRGIARFVLDLQDCLLMDSTFLGVLARIGMGLSGEVEPRPRLTVQLLNPNERIVKLLDNLGVMEHFEILRANRGPADTLTSVQPGNDAASREEITRTSLDAHQALIELNPANKEKFKDVTQFLEEELKQMGTQPGPGEDKAHG